MFGHCGKERGRCSFREPPRRKAQQHEDAHPPELNPLHPATIRGRRLVLSASWRATANALRKRGRVVMTVLELATTICINRLTQKRWDYSGRPRQTRSELHRLPEGQGAPRRADAPPSGPLFAQPSLQLVTPPEGPRGCCARREWRGGSAGARGAGQRGERSVPRTRASSLRRHYRAWVERRRLRGQRLAGRRLAAWTTRAISG